MSTLHHEIPEVSRSGEINTFVTALIMIRISVWVIIVVVNTTGQTSLSDRVSFVNYFEQPPKRDR